MSDFLARIAARAVGAPARAQPRPFERSEHQTRSDLGIEILEERVAAPVPSPAAAPRRSTVAPERELAPPSALGGLGGANLAQHPGVALPREETGAEAAPLPRVMRIGDSTDGGIALPPRLETDAPVLASASVPVAPIAPVLVQAAPLRDGPPPKVSSAAVASERAAAPTVRVHIGRLEVRANLQEAPKPPRGREAARAEGLSLSDYLRGKREAG
jgi:hypothetical protein